MEEDVDPLSGDRSDDRTHLCVVASLGLVSHETHNQGYGRGLASIVGLVARDCRVLDRACAEGNSTSSFSGEGGAKEEERPCFVGPRPDISSLGDSPIGTPWGWAGSS